MRVPQVSERIKEAPAQALRGVFAGIGQLLLITDKLKNKAPANRDVSRARAPQAAKTVTDTSPAGQAAPPADAETAPAAATEAAATEAAPAKPAATRRPAAKPATPKPAARPATPKPAAKPATAKPAVTRRPAAGPAGAGPAGAGPAGAGPAGAGPAGQAPKPSKPQGSRDLDKTGNVRLLGDEDGGPAPDAEPVSGAADAAPPLPNYGELSVASLRARLRNLDVAQVRRLADYERAHAARDDVLAMFERRIAKLEAQSSEAGPPEAGA